MRRPEVQGHAHAGSRACGRKVTWSGNTPRIGKDARVAAGIADGAAQCHSSARRNGAAWRNINRGHWRNISHADQGCGRRLIAVAARHGHLYMIGTGDDRLEADAMIIGARRARNKIGPVGGGNGPDISERGASLRVTTVALTAIVFPCCGLAGAEERVTFQADWSTKMASPLEAVLPWPSLAVTVTR